MKTITVTDEEFELIEDFRSLVPQCQVCVKQIMEAAVQASQINGTVLDFLQFSAMKY